MFGFFGALISAFIAWWKARGPSLAQQESEKVGSEGAQLQTETAANEEITRTAEVGAQLEPKLDLPDGVRDYAKSDPNNRAG